MSGAASSALAEAPAGWRRAFELAWESYGRGSRPIGAVIVDPAGRVVATGRDRTRDMALDLAGLAGSDVGHAALDAIRSLGRGRGNCGLLTTLEPCVMCGGAVLVSGLGRVQFAAADGFLGIRRFPELGERLDNRGLVVAGPDPGPLGMLAGALPLEYELRAGGPAGAIDAWRQDPAVDRLARRLLTKGRLPELARTSPLDALLARVDALFE